MDLNRRDELNKFLTLENIDQAYITEICHIQGISAVKAPQIKVTLEVGKKISSKPSKKI
jgi:DNA repair protein RadC